jgi:hypothetical protein
VLAVVRGRGCFVSARSRRTLPAAQLIAGGFGQKRTRDGGDCYGLPGDRYRAARRAVDAAFVVYVDAARLDAADPEEKRAAFVAWVSREFPGGAS